MSTIERTIVHGITGEEITFVECCHETNDEYLFIRVKLPPEGEGPPLHYHLAFEEMFEVEEGELTVTVRDKEMKLTPRDQVTIPVGVNHRFTNSSNEPVTFTVRLTPGHQFEESMRIGYGLIEDGKVNEKGMPKNIIHTALILKMQDTYICEIPKPVQYLLFNNLANLGRWLGVEKALMKKYLPEYLQAK
ncbi:cupin domain-containing protein [Alkalihalobacterium sp. APHAB7]|uniref:cupin domain-containing protein n=1 Tax=Alkalihalobacterium sp. APHAB7 TaxID=3402081 RepID=UPI003AB00D2A